MPLSELTNGCWSKKTCASGLPHKERLHTHRLLLKLSERKSWSNDFWHRLVTGKETREGKTEQGWEDQTSQQFSVEQGTEMTTRRGLSESLPQGAPGMVEELLVCWDKGGQRERQHTSLCYFVGGRREGWRNNLDGLCLIKEKERKRQKKRDKNRAHIVRLRVLGWAFCSRDLHLNKSEHHCFLLLSSAVCSAPDSQIKTCSLKSGKLFNIYKSQFTKTDTDGFFFLF